MSSISHAEHRDRQAEPLHRLSGSRLGAAAVALSVVSVACAGNGGEDGLINRPNQAAMAAEETGIYRHEFQYSDAPDADEIAQVLAPFEVPLDEHADLVADVLARWVAYDYTPDLTDLRLLDFDSDPDAHDLVLIPKELPIGWIEAASPNGLDPSDPGSPSDPFPSEDAQAFGFYAALAQDVETQPASKLAMMVPAVEVAAGPPVSISNPTAPLSYEASGPGGADWARTNQHCYAREQNSTGWMDTCYHVFRVTNDGDVNKDFVAWRQFSSFESRGWTKLYSANNKMYPDSIQTRADEWVDWDPRANFSGACRQINLSVSYGGATIGSSPTSCETWEVNKASWPGGYRLVWFDSFGTNNVRELDYWVEVGRGAEKVTAMKMFTCFSTYTSQCR